MDEFAQVQKLWHQKTQQGDSAAKPLESHTFESDIFRMTTFGLFQSQAGLPENVHVGLVFSRCELKEGYLDLRHRMNCCMQRSLSDPPD